MLKIQKKNVQKIVFFQKNLRKIRAKDLLLSSQNYIAIVAKQSLRKFLKKYVILVKNPILHMQLMEFVDKIILQFMNSLHLIWLKDVKLLWEYLKIFIKSLIFFLKIKTWEETVEKALLNRGNNEEMEHELCNVQTKACLGVDMENISQYDNIVTVNNKKVPLNKGGLKIDSEDL
ncbi:hypothetical protein IMG5_009070 [Ichthyophthirius multifiliis]|uniref:Uncharacterized protein n=1 Tax=Ichthyophthirius multifiliis TaxID=5932 RepID=G0QJT8_ICHMU|nr:hypothetical protein IMG5_009070 [Ichthyophthirius multifiliis]EGR34517.1 hypothetical protein IMG5_009070 [Ichthyophthirius multifiliis]|eukprot:XP_004039821.1 hypothetical protein IMG5_009070 [Ichthyophthirius multifiliis]